jgi:antitoxin FitA
MATGRGVCGRTETKPQSFWSSGGNTVPTNIILIGIADDLYCHLRRSAQANQRSISSEAIACLESLLLPKRTAESPPLAAVRATRIGLPKDGFNHDDIDSFKREGRL